MSFLPHIDVIVLTWNEAPNIGRTLDALREFPEVLVLDSGSTDETLEIAGRYRNVRILHRVFDSHAQQWNHALRECGLNREWTLALDADYLLTPECVQELVSLQPSDAIVTYKAGFEYRVLGRALSRSLYPPVTVLFRREAAHYVQDGHTQRLVAEGPGAHLESRIVHDDRKPLTRWLSSQDRYAAQECDLLLSRPWSALGWADRLRRLVVITPWLVPLYCLTVRRGLLDGRAGLYYALQRGIAEALLGLKLLEARAARRTSGS